MKPLHSIIRKMGVAALFAGCLCPFLSCGNKKKEDVNIITTKPARQQKKATQSVGDYAQKRNIEWLGSTYTVSTERKADPTLPLCKDEQGNSYYDNRITVAISRKDGSVFFKRTFTKADFSAYAKGVYAKEGALLGVVFNRTDADRLLFAASVGSPDNMSDNFVPIVVQVSRTGAVSMREDDAIDTGTDEAPDGGNDDEGV